MSDEPGRVYIVTSGSYSDYGIQSVWTTREAAEQAASDWAEVEEWVLNEQISRPVIRWQASLKLDGSITVADRPQEHQEVAQTQVWDAPARDWRGDFVLQGVGYGTTPEHARKNLADALAQYKAERGLNGS